MCVCTREGRGGEGYSKIYVFQAELPRELKLNIYEETEEVLRSVSEIM